MAETVGAATTRSLTPREMEVARLFALGLTWTVICEDLGICRNTVWKHRAAIYRKLNVATMAEAWAVLGWLKVP